MSMRLPLHRRGVGASLAAATLVYGIAVAFATGVTGYGVHRVAQALMGDLGGPQKAAIAAAKPDSKTPEAAHTSGAASQPVVVREAAMTPTQDRWSRPSWRRGSSDRYYYGPQYGSSSRGYSRRGGFFDNLFGSDSDWDRPRDTYRTVCVRMCDGYYFPVSFSVTPDRFERDRQSCENSCGSEGRLFIYRNPGGEPEDMQDLQGRPYRQLRTAFLYRTEYVADCKCKPHPWEQQARDQHRVYALAAAKRKGDKGAAAQLAELQAQMREPSGEARPTKAARWSQGSATDARESAKAEQRPRSVASEAELMRLGTPPQAGAREQGRRQQQPSRDWVGDLWKRAY
jgi:hypothetical protein